MEGQWLRGGVFALLHSDLGPEILLSETRLNSLDSRSALR